jgi:hypothetical protein
MRLVRGLNRFGRGLRDILDATLAITTNFTYCEQRGEQRGEQVSLLDTDVVFSALRLDSTLNLVGDPARHGGYAAMRRIAGELASNSAPTDEGSALEQQMNAVIGSHTMRHVVLDLISGSPRQRYALPPGTQYELLRHFERGKRHLAEQTKALLAGFDRALESADPIHTLKDSGILAKLPETLSPALGGFMTAYDDAVLLRQIFEGAEPINDLVQYAPPVGIEQAYRASLQLLSGIDSTRTRNHALDATNVALLVWMLSAPASRGLVPILISNTRALRLASASLQEAIWLALDRAHRAALGSTKAGYDSAPPRAPNELSIVNSHFYLMIWQRLARIGWSTSGAHQHASALASATNNVLRGLGRLRLALDKPEARESALRIFGLELEQYLSDWQGILGGMRHDAREDSVTLRNTLLSNKLVELIQLQYPDTSRRLAQERIRAVHTELVEIARENAEVDALIVNTVESISDPGQHFQFSGHELRKSLPSLSDLRPGSGTAHEWVSAERVVTHCRFLPWEGALFVIDLRRALVPGASPLVEVTWVHAADASQLANKSAEASTTLLGRTPGEVVDVALCYSRFMKREEVSERRLSVWLADALATSPYPDEFQITWGPRALAFDVEPMGRERRAQFQVPLSEWTTELCGWLAKFMMQTKLLSVDEAHVRWALDRIVGNFAELAHRNEAG